MANCLGKVAVGLNENAFNKQLQEIPEDIPLRTRDGSAPTNQGKYIFKDYRLKDLRQYAPDE